MKGLLILLLSVSAHAGNITNEVSIVGPVSGDFAAINVSITVASGVGFGVFSATGTLRQCMVKPPTSVATFDWEVITDDADQFPLMGRQNLLGDVSLWAKRMLLGAYRIDLENATDGTYKTRCIYQL